MAPPKLPKTPKLPKKALKSIEKPIENLISNSKKIKKKNYNSFAIYLYKVLRLVAEDNALGISKHSMMIVDNFVSDLLERLAVEASRLVVHGKKSTMGIQDFQSAVRLLLPGELAKHANVEGIKALSKYHKTKQE